MMDVVRLSQNNVHPDVICEQIRATNSSFQLSTADIEYLTQCQVDSRVIRTMQSARAASIIQSSRPIVVRETVPVYVAPPPPMIMAPPAVGFHYHRRW
ncbi:MAG: hypothetical protein ACRCZF_09615, partial [Gemmataceae bacterium]